jgi:hypothetical protein
VSDDGATPKGDGIAKLHEQLLAAGVTGMTYHEDPLGWGSSITIPWAQWDKMLALPGWRPEDQPPIRGAKP